MSTNAVSEVPTPSDKNDLVSEEVAGMKWLIVITTLTKYFLGVQNKGERALFQTVWAGGAVGSGLLLGLCCRHFWPSYPLSIYTLLFWFMLIPSSIWIARLVWPQLQNRTSPFANPFSAIQYLDDEYCRDKRRIDGLPVNRMKKARMHAKRYEQFLAECEPFRQTILHSADRKLHHKISSVTITCTSGKPIPAIV